MWLYQSPELLNCFYKPLSDNCFFFFFPDSVGEIRSGQYSFPLDVLLSCLLSLASVFEWSGMWWCPVPGTRPGTDREKHWLAYVRCLAPGHTESSMWVLAPRPLTHSEADMKVTRLWKACEQVSSDGVLQSNVICFYMASTVKETRCPSCPSLTLF